MAGTIRDQAALSHPGLAVMTILPLAFFAIYSQVQNTHCAQSSNSDICCAIYYLANYMMLYTFHLMLVIITDS